jgi:hypothetical protein
MPQNIGCIKNENRKKKWQKVPNLLNLLHKNEDKKLFLSTEELIPNGLLEPY